MKVTRTQSFVLRIPTPTALGYTLAVSYGGAEALQVYPETRLEPRVFGRDPPFVELLWERADPG